ncbi:MAG: DUF3299 domain-containing protein [Pirellulaceae bacterium]
MTKSVSADRQKADRQKAVGRSLGRLAAWLIVCTNVVLLSSCGPPDRARMDAEAAVEQPAAPAPPERVPKALAPDPDGTRPAPARPVGEGERRQPVTPGELTTQGRRSIARPLRPGAMNDITFDDLELDMPLGTLFDRSMLTPRAAQLDGQQVRLRGFIYAGGVFQQSGITSFPLVKNTECKFGPDGLAFCVILVDLDEGVSTEFTTYPVTVEGRLTVRPYDSGGFTWSVYHLQGQRVF